MRRLTLLLTIAAPLWLAGCDMLGIESASTAAAKREADGRAIGAGCRHAARSVEQCFALNKRADRAAVFAGWREMNDYMRENKIEEVPPQIAGVAAKPAAEEVADAHVEKRPAKGSESKAKDKPKARES